jgi:hypothetical protein
MDHYGSAPFLVWLRSVFQTGVLNEKELNERKTPSYSPPATPPITS